MQELGPTVGGQPIEEDRLDALAKAGDSLDGAARVLKEQLPVVGVEDLSPPGSETLRLVVDGEEETGDLREALFRFAVEQGWTLLELNRSQSTLEDVFRELTLEGGNEAGGTVQ